MKRLAKLLRPSENRWVYFLPALHICACVTSMLGYVAPRLQFLGIIWTYVMLLDFPISAVAFALAWQHGALATIWIVVIGTLWWYLVSRGVELVFGGRKTSGP